MTDLPVLIAGAGPAGCTVALHLAQRGWPVVLFESEEALPLDLRASTFHPPTLDLLDTLDVTRRLIPLGLKSPTYQYRDRRTGEAATFDLAVLGADTGHPYRLQCEQFKMTQVVCDMLRELPSARVHFSHRVEDARQDAGGVTAVVDTPQGRREFRGSYLIGCDGAGSRVRKAIGVEYVGFTYPEKFLVVSTPCDFPARFPGLTNVNYVSDPEEWCVILKTLTLWRVLFPTSPQDTEERLLSDDYIQARLRHLVPGQASFEVVHRTLYRVHQRVAATYRVDRVLLAGDAAHINNPLGGMGMNGGLHDAFNLADKLVQILAGTAGEELLDQYDRQRRAVALQFVQEHTIRNKRLMEEKDPQLQRARQQEFMRTAADPELARRFLMKTSMIQSLRDSAAIR